MTEILTGQTLAEAEAVFQRFHARVTTGEMFDLAPELEDAAERLEPLTGVRAYPARVKCATLAWHAFDAALKNGVLGRHREDRVTPWRTSFRTCRSCPPAPRIENRAAGGG